jgi:hypothetical protein
MEMRFEAKAQPGERMRSVLVNGEELQAAKRYTIAGCEREGEPLDFICRLRGAKDVEYVTPTVHEAAESYLLSQKVLSPVREKRSRATDLPDRAFSQDSLLASFS